MSPHDSRATVIRVAGDPAPSFAAEVRAQVRRAPWLLISIGFHALLLVALDNIVWSQSTRPRQRILTADRIPDVVAQLEDVVPPPSPTPPEILDPVIDDPVVTEDDFEDLPESEDRLAPVAASFDAPQNHDVIGAGGGGGPDFGGKYAGRGQRSRTTAASQKAVDAGLLWLRDHQDPAGFWDCDGFSSQCESNLCDGRGQAYHDVGVTGLALLAFLGAGHTPRSGTHQRVVMDGLHWLTLQQDREDGCVGAKSCQQFLYSHAIAALALVEGYALSRMPSLREPAQRALHFAGRARNPYGAWRYDYPPGGDSDVSVTGWMLLALFAGRDCGLEVDERAIQGGMQYVDEMTDPATLRTGYRSRGSPPAREENGRELWPADESESMTAVSLLLRFFQGEDPARSAVMKGQAELLAARPPLWDEARGSIDFYYWYYASYAMWQMSGPHWKSWQKQMLAAVVETQRQDGDETGSWDPQVDPWGAVGGRVYSTAICTLCLEVYYRYDHVFPSR